MLGTALALTRANGREARVHRAATKPVAEMMFPEDLPWHGLQRGSLAPRRKLSPWIIRPPGPPSHKKQGIRSKNRPKEARAGFIARWRASLALQPSKSSLPRVTCPPAKAKGAWPRPGIPCFFFCGWSLKRLNLFERHRIAEITPLGVSKTDPGAHFRLCCGLDPLGNGLND